MAGIEYKNDALCLNKLNIGVQYEQIEDPEGRSEITIDRDDNIISYRKFDGTKMENVGFESPKITTNSLNLSKSGMTDFQKDMKDSGFGINDWTDREVIELPEPKHYALLNIIIDSLPINSGDVHQAKIQYYDGLGNYFNMGAEMEIQGQTSRVFARTGGKGNYTLDLPKDIKFGSWVPQDSFHLKGCAKDVTRGFLATSYKLAYNVMKYLDAKPNRVLLKDNSEITTTHASGDRMTDWGDGARCLSDGFPVEVYINGSYWGLYALQLKKHRKNYSMDKKDYSSFFIDAEDLSGFWLGNIPWTKFDIKGPKNFVCMDGSEFDGDNPKELIDSTSSHYDSTDKTHTGSATTKAIIESFSTKYLEVKGLVNAGTTEALSEAKALFADYFDINACMLVFIFNCTMRNGDSITKNTLWATYKNGKIAPMLWDLDGMYGEGWIGFKATAPDINVWNNYANAEWPLKLFWTLYESEIRDTYRLLRRDNIISIDSWRKVVYGWKERIGVEAYKRDIEKWSETPSYRKNYTNTQYWEMNDEVNINDYQEWNSSTSYTQGDKVAIRCWEGSLTAISFTAIQDVPAGDDYCPVTKFYTNFPVVGGYYNSYERMEKWMLEQITLCDSFIGFSN